MKHREDGQVCADPEPAESEETPLIHPVVDESDDVPARTGCRSHLRGWAGAHLHGAVRPRRRAARRGRPPGRWC